MESSDGMTRVYDGYIKIDKVDDYERVVHPGAVCILAYNDTWIHFVEQYRPVMERKLLELPAGTREPGEPAFITAQRELYEETGISAKDWTHVKSFLTSPGWTTERIELFAATDLEFHEAQPTSDEEETNLKLVRKPISELDALIESTENAKCLIALLWLREHLRKQKEEKPAAKHWFGSIPKRRIEDYEEVCPHHVPCVVCPSPLLKRKER